ncbi:MAG TPA: prolyl oligopeptidase family serine peptidase, partial [Nitrososphaerales archaeon]|nr:prolyl oligopeptidase family serine peptidase [Nitrososphaerales archaeon]
MALKEKQIALFGSWKSPISAALVAESSNVYSEPKIAADGSVFFLEMRPSEKGRYVIIRASPGAQVEDVIPPEFNARDRVHEYGGAAYAISPDGSTVYFSNFADQRIYRIKKGSRATAVTTSSDVFYADYAVDVKRNQLICVQEDHRVAGEAVNSIVAIDLGAPGKVSVLVSGNDFYSSPRLSPDGTKLTWLTWNHPSLPFFGSELWTADISSTRTLSNQKKIAGSTDESIAEPRWSPGGILYFVSDRSNWWNIYRFANGSVEIIHQMAAEFAGPHWIFGYSSYAFLSEAEIICEYSKDGFSHLALIDTATKTMTDLKNPFSAIRYVASNGEIIVVMGGSSTEPAQVYSYSRSTTNFERIYPNKESKLVQASYLSLPAPIEYPTEENRTAHALFYAPKNEDFEGPKGSLPPLIVFTHGGPTGQTDSELDLGIQYWTSRGFAVVDVNYGGSTGYGREYRMRLDGKWGVVDVDDCVNAALYLVDMKIVNRDMLIIRGGSAGGYTTLSALAFRNVFNAGASYYGISDLDVFTKDTHKFESRYGDFLIGPYPE